ncbi:MAG: phospholipid carrier-dependent glycosyltransferase [Elusimicrobiota bacterium]
MGCYNTNAVPFILIGRLLTVAFSIGTIYLTYLLAKKLFDKKTGLLSALFLSLIWQHIISSHYATTDITAAFFTLLAVYFVWNVSTKTDLKSYLLAGFSCGLSIAAKYYGGIIFLAIILFGWKNKKYILFSFFAMILGFFVGCPYAFIDSASFFEKFIDRFNLIVGGEKSELFHGFLSYFDILIRGLGHFLIITSVLGIVFLIINRIKQNIFLLVITLTLIIFFGSWKGLYGHYILALYPFFAIISASFIKKTFVTTKSKTFTTECTEVTEKEFRIKTPCFPCSPWQRFYNFPYRNKVAFVVVIMIFLITTLPRIIKTDVLLSQKDTRIIAREWVLKNIPEKSKILRGPFCPEFNSDNYFIKIDWYDKIKNGDFAEIQKKFDYVITSSLHGDPETFTVNMEKYGNKIYEISKESIGAFQNPTIKIWKLR